MLDVDTKRRIDTCRDILVGKVPDPKSQVEQITIALIYKFMDDMDTQSEEAGGKRTYFAGDFEKYAWRKLMAPSVGGQELLNSYAEAIARMPENPGIPPLFRDIFKNAFLPYRDPETLRLFLKEINGFTYDHSERLGDAFEYLLSVLGSQGDAGQFRTPRHIIDFIVKIVDPKKGEKVLDPACGTAGFLISAYNHILDANTKDRRGDQLSPDERTHLADNFHGYDISPDMVRLSLANMYLHGFREPDIVEYDTLTSEDKWNELADVILANPPFMSPKGGIRPHKKFSVQSNRSEVLFVDYIAEHLTAKGRAGVIVPEGIIFQSGTAYKALRRMLVQQYLVAVVSLPGGVFNPYSGVKTSILILDKSLAKQSETVGFFKVENDGFGLGAQRRPVERNDLPQVLLDIKEYLSRLWAKESVSGAYFTSTHGLIIAKEKIASNGDYILSGERYREGAARDQHWPLGSLGSVVEIQSGSRQKGGAVDSGVPSIGGEQIDEDGRIRIDKMKYVTEEHFAQMTKGKLRRGDVLIVKDGATTGKTGFFDHDWPAAVNEHVFILRATNAIDAYFLYRAVRAPHFQKRLQPYIKGIIGGISLEIRDLEIPLPPLEVQKEIVAEIEGNQRVIDGARAVIDNYRPNVSINPEWPMVPLGDHFTTSSGGTPSKENRDYWVGDIPWVSPKDMKSDLILDTIDHITESAVSESATKLFPAQTVVCVVRSGILKHSFPVALLSRPMCINQDLVAFQPKNGTLTSEFLFYLFKARSSSILEEGIKPGVTVQSFYNGFFKAYQVPLPPLAEQERIVAEVQAEQRLVDASRELIARMESKTASTLARIWGANV